MDQVELTYLGHSCFRLDYGGQRIVLDPYADGSVPGLKPLRQEAEFVFCSHGHQDHNAAQCVRLTQPHPVPRFALSELETDHDASGGRERGKNTIRVFTFGTIRVAHFGDLGRALTDREAEALSGLDAVLIPVGGYYTIDAAQAKKILDTIRPRVAVLMHFRTDHAGYDVLSRLDEVVRAMGDVRFAGERFTLDADTPEQIIIMKPKED